MGVSEIKTKTRLLCIHYNGNSSGSFVDAALTRCKLLSEDYDLHFMMGSEGPFTKSLRQMGLKVTVSPMHECGESLHTCIVQFARFFIFLLRHRIDLIYVMDFVHWKPIELVTATFLRIPTVLFCGFYKPAVFAESYLKQCTQIVTNSHATAERIADGKFMQKTAVIYNSIDPSKYEPRNVKPPKQLTLGFIGSLIPIKGIEDLITAVPRIRDAFPLVKVKIAGGNRDNTDYPLKLQALTKELGVEDSVEFIGHIDNPADFLSKIDTLVVPSHDEPFGYINIEAAAAGVAVVATKVGGIPEIVLDRETGLLVPAKSPSSIADACIELAKNNSLRHELIENSRSRVISNFSHQVCMHKWVDLIDGLSVNHNLK